MAVLITGGAGYIGSHTVVEFIRAGETVVVLDNLYQGHPEAVQGVHLIEADLRDQSKVVKILREFDIESVIHFAANSLVGESVQDPLKYYDNNVGGTRALLSAMTECGVGRIVFSSSAATYGEPVQVPIPETHPQVPTNPYGETKLVIERMLRWCHVAYNLASVSLRYFNAAGAHPDGHIGEDHDPETHLVPIVLSVALGQRPHLPVFGDDYATQDGTCIRDYVHVMDLASAHHLALGRLREKSVCEAYNLGSGSGYSVLEIVEAARRVTGHPIPVVVSGRRAGDPAVLIASSEKARTELSWRPRHESIESMIASAWEWHSKHPLGYGRA
ncbi:MAG: UDP-glucose 4-epimerase GalE [Firmicutes bacterium]|nr:UDP-glucose 4-epimerase GalE [Bacillota bacterium]